MGISMQTKPQFLLEFVRRSRFQADMSDLLLRTVSSDQLSGIARKIARDNLVNILNDLEVALTDVEHPYPRFNERSFRAAQRHQLIRPGRH